MKKWLSITITIMALVAIIYGIQIGNIYLKLATRSERELWRITDYRVSNPIAVDDLIIFHGFKADRSVDCDCLYAVNKSTGNIVWSTEELAQPYIEEATRLGLHLSASASVITSIELVSPTSEFMHVSLSYWATQDARTDILFAINSKDGTVIWKADGATDSDSLLNSIEDTNRIFLIDSQGDLLAIDSSTGHELWRRSVYEEYDGDGWFTYYRNIVLVPTFSSECLTCCCQFSSEKQHYEQFGAFSAETGQPIWQTDRLDRGNMYTFDTTLYVVSSPWENSSAMAKRDDKLLTAIDLGTGKKRWDSIFQDADAFSMASSNSNQTLLFIKNYQGGPNDFHEYAKIIVIDEFTGKPVWKFNENFLRGDLGYRIDNDSIYVGTEDGFVYSLDKTTGNVIWKSETVAFPVYFLVDGDSLIAVYYEKFVSGLDAKTGVQNWILDLGIDDSWSVLGEEILKYNSNTIYVAGNDNQQIYAVDRKTGNILWSWKHFQPTSSEYEFELLDNNVLGVDQRRHSSFINNLFGKYWFFALKT